MIQLLFLHGLLHLRFQIPAVRHDIEQRQRISRKCAWAVDEAMRFYRLPAATREREIARIMDEAAVRFNYRVTAQHYIEIYEKMLARPLVNRNTEFA